jgi:hypothetical protein
MQKSPNLGILLISRKLTERKNKTDMGVKGLAITTVCVVMELNHPPPLESRFTVDRDYRSANNALHFLIISSLFFLNSAC